MNRGMWMDLGAEPEYPRYLRDNIMEPFFDARWVAAKADPLGYLKDVRNKGLKRPGVYLCSQGEDSLGAWPSHATTAPEKWADWAYDLVQRKIAPGTTGQFPLVDLNCEISDPDWAIAMLRRFRKHSPRRALALVLESHKYPLFEDKGLLLKSLNVIIKPECYVGNMARVESATEVLEWAKIVGPNLVIPCLDAEQLGEWWAGTAFISGRLP